MRQIKTLFLFPFILHLIACTGNQKPSNEKDENEEELLIENGLEVSAIGKEYSPDTSIVPIFQLEANSGGSTSVRNVDKDNLEWKDQGYFQRNRDLGQVFTPEKDFWLNAIVLQTGPSNKAVLSQAPGAKVFVQFFEVVGTPKINDNATPPGTESTHGFTRIHRADDYIEGIEYRPIKVVTGGTFPTIPPTFEGEQEVNGDEGKLVFMRWKLRNPMQFQGGKRYAFMVGFEEVGKELGFTLANINGAGIDAPPSLEDENDPYKGGWGIRREGDGTIPPSMNPAEEAPEDGESLDLFYRESLFGTGENRYLLTPATDGYPDVDTYRDLTFALEVYWEKP